MSKVVGNNCWGFKAPRSQHKRAQQLHVIFLIRYAATLAICPAGSALQYQMLSYLKEIGWQLFMSVTIIEGQSCGETRHRDTMLDSSADCSAPWLLNKEIKTG